MRITSAAFFEEKEMKEKIRKTMEAAAILMMAMAMTVMAAPGDVAIGMAPGVEAIITDTPGLPGEKETDGFRESILLTDLGLSPAQQKRFWMHAKAHGYDEPQTMKIYVFYVATAWAESNFCTGATHHNANGTTDGGIMQIFGISRNTARREAEEAGAIRHIGQRLIRVDMIALEEFLEEERGKANG